LLELLVRVVDAQLLESVEFENFEAGDIEDTDEERSGEIGGEGAVDDFDEPLEESIEDSLADGFEGEIDLVDGLTFGDVLRTDLDSWCAEGFCILSSRNTKHVASEFSVLVSLWLGLFFSRLLLELHVSRVHETRSNHVDASLFFVVESENIKRLVGRVEFFNIVD